MTLSIGSSQRLHAARNPSAVSPELNRAPRPRRSRILAMRRGLRAAAWQERLRLLLAVYRIVQLVAIAGWWLARKMLQSRAAAIT